VLRCLLLAVLLSAPALAASPVGPASPPASATVRAGHEVVTVKVNGMVCDFCARAVEKVFRKRTEVADLTIDLDEGTIVFDMVPGKTIDDAVLSKLIKDAGYALVSIERAQVSG
jgi:copper chaperone CopZ